MPRGADVAYPEMRAQFRLGLIGSSGDVSSTSASSEGLASPSVVLPRPHPRPWGNETSNVTSPAHAQLARDLAAAATVFI